MFKSFARSSGSLGSKKYFISILNFQINIFISPLLSVLHLSHDWAASVNVQVVEFLFHCLSTALNHVGFDIYGLCDANVWFQGFASLCL